MRRAAIGLAALALLATACGGNPTTEPTPSASTTQGPTASASPSPSSGDDRVAWERVDAPAGTEVLRGDDVTLALDKARSTATLGEHTIKAGAGRVFESADLDDGEALLVSRPENDEGDQSGALVDAASGRSRSVQGAGVIAPSPVGAWALGDDHVAYTSQQGSAVFCLTVADTESFKGRVVRCGKAREGLTQLRMNDDRVGFTTFVNAQPMACLSLWTADLDGGDAVPISQATKCRGWEVVPTDDGAAWSEVVRPAQVELGRVRALDGDSVVELGTGSTGTLTGCDDWVWWAQPPGDGHGDRLMRWRDGGQPEVAYDTKSAESPVTALSCSDDRLSFVVVDGADEQTYVARD